MHQWMKDAGLRAKPAVDTFPVPPIPAGLKVERHLDEAKALRLVTDFGAAIEAEDDRGGLEWLMGQVLNTMTANRITSLQAHRLVSQIVRKVNGGGHRACRVTRDGELVELMPEGINEGGA